MNSRNRAIKDSKLLDGLIANIVSGRGVHASPTQIDGILNWLSRSQGQTGNSVLIEGSQVPTEIACRAVYMFLDNELFSQNTDPYRLLGLTKNCSFEKIRSRYKRLLHVFHPDRHADDQEWFTKRTEEINHAYGFLKKYHNAPRPPETQIRPQDHRQFYTGDENAFQVPRSKKSKISSRLNKAEIRRRLLSCVGSPNRLQKGIYAALFFVFFILILIAYVNNRAVMSAGKDLMDSKVATASDQTLKSTLPEVQSGRSWKGATPAELEKNPQVRFSDPQSQEINTAADLAAGPTSSGVFYNQSEKGGAIVGGENGGGEPSAPDETVNVPMTPTGVVTQGEYGIDAVESRSLMGISAPERNAPKRAISPTRPDLQPGAAGESEVEIVSARGLEIPVDAARYEKIDTTSAGITSGVARRNQDMGSKSKSPQFNAHDETTGISPLTRQYENDILAVKAFLEKFRSAFNLSDIDHLDDMLHRDARGRTTASKTGIIEAYLELFRLTEERTLLFEDVGVEMLGGRQFKADAKYSEERRWIFPKNWVTNESGRFQAHLILVDGELKIWRLEH